MTRVSYPFPYFGSKRVLFLVLGTILALGRHCVGLQTLDLSGCSGLSGTDFAAIRNLPSLRKLILSGTKVQDRDIYDIFTDNGGPQSLSTLFLDETNVTNAALSAMTANLQPDSLRTFSIARNKHVDDKAMEPFVVHFSKLAFLDISFCPQLRNGTIVKVLDSLGDSLKVLDCSGNPNFTTQAFEECLQALKQLVRLSLRFVA
jgi:Leucine-rich repeat (LRR) protein